jgi:ribonuclease HII
MRVATHAYIRHRPLPQVKRAPDHDRDTLGPEMALRARAKANRRAAQRLHRLLRRERELWQEGCGRIAGVDEAGMGPLAGPVVAAAVIFPPGTGLRGVDDSKRVGPAARERLAERIRAEALAWAVVEVEPREIDALNIYRAGLAAMRRALELLDPPPDRVLVDGRQIPDLAIPQERVVHGDATCHAIAAASILAKTRRDARMVEYDACYPGYGFAGHKGYATAAHRDAIRRLGPSPIHRRSFLLLPHPRLWD